MGVHPVETPRPGSRTRVHVSLDGRPVPRIRQLTDYEPVTRLGISKREIVPEGPILPFVVGRGLEGTYNVPSWVALRISRVALTGRVEFPGTHRFSGSLPTEETVVPQTVS